MSTLKVEIKVASCILGTIVIITTATTTFNVDDDGCVHACMYMSEWVSESIRN